MAKKWYVLHTYSGYENKVRQNLLQRIETMGMEDKVFKIEIPTETVTEIKEGGKRVESEKKVLPGYVLVRMELDPLKVGELLSRYRLVEQVFRVQILAVDERREAKLVAERAARAERQAKKDAAAAAAAPVAEEA